MVQTPRVSSLLPAIAQKEEKEKWSQIYFDYIITTWSTFKMIFELLHILILGACNCKILESNNYI